MKKEFDTKLYRLFFRYQDLSRIDAINDSLPGGQYLYLSSFTTGLFLAYDGRLSNESLICIKLAFEVRVIEDDWG